MDNARINSSSADYTIFPYYTPAYAPYHLPDASANTLYATEQAYPDSNRENIRPASFSQSGDSIFISEHAKYLYAATSSAAQNLPALLNMPLENISLYNQIRQERENLEPGDPRIIELSNKLRAILAAGEKSVSEEELDFIRTYADWSGKSDTSSANITQGGNITGRVDDSSLTSAPLSYNSPEATTDSPLHKGRISASFSAKFYDYAPDNSVNTKSLHRVA